MNVVFRNNRRLPFRGFLAQLAAAWIALTLIIPVVRGVPWPEAGWFAFHSFTVLALFAGFVSLRPVSAFLRCTPRRPQWIVGMIVALFFAGHLMNADRQTFPFVRWDMFTWSWEPEEIVFHEVVGVRSDGAQAPLNYTRLLPSLQNCFIWFFERAGEHVRTHPELGPHYDDMLRAMGEKYNRRRRHAPIDEVVVVRGVIRPRSDGATTTREVLRRVNLRNQERR